MRCFNRWLTQIHHLGGAGAFLHNCRAKNTHKCSPPAIPIRALRNNSKTTACIEQCVATLLCVINSAYYTQECCYMLHEHTTNTRACSQGHVLEGVRCPRQALWAFGGSVYCSRIPQQCSNTSRGPLHLPAWSPTDMWLTCFSHVMNCDSVTGVSSGMQCVCVRVWIWSCVLVQTK